MSKRTPGASERSLEHWPNKQLVKDARVIDATIRRSTKTPVKRMHAKGAIRTFARAPLPEELA
jgi:hypothetical protein